MTGVLGISQAWRISAAFVPSAFLTDLGGALNIPNKAVSL